MPPGTGIVHQVNIEHLARVVLTERETATAYPDTCVGTDSHTTMQNGLGVLGWGVGGIEAEAAMLGQPISMLIPRVVGFKLTGELPAGATATDLVLTITEMLRKHGVVGKFVEFYGEGVGAVPLANRATIGNMSPEFGSTCAIFPIDGETIEYLKLTGRPAEQVALVEAYAKEQGLWHDPAPRAGLLRVPRAGPGHGRPVDRRPQAPAGPHRADGRQEAWRARRPRLRAERRGPARRGDRRVVPGLRLPGRSARRQRRRAAARPAARRPAAQAGPGHPADGAEFELDHGAVVIAAITSLHQHLEPLGHDRRRAARQEGGRAGLTRKPWVKTSLAPGSKVVTDYYDRAGLTPYLEKLGFNLVGYGCTTCIGNSGPLQEEISRRSSGQRPGRRRGAVGQPQLRGPDQPRHQDELPGLAAAGRRLRPRGLDGRRRRERPARHRLRRRAGLPRRTSGRRRRRSRRSSSRRSPRRCSPPTTPTCSPASSAGRRCRCRAATPSSGTPTRPTSARRRTSTAWRRSPSRSPTSPAPGCSRMLGDSVTTDHISPGGRDQGGQPGGPVPHRARRRAPATSTPTARAAATTR